MPVLLASKEKLFEYIDQVFTDDAFDELCFRFGIELDDITSERKMMDKETATGNITHDDLSEEVLYKIEIPANRYDLLSLEGLAIALRVFLGKDNIPKYNVVCAAPVETITVHSSTRDIRPYVFAAILRNVQLDAYSYDSFIKLQDKLHQTLGRDRKLVSMGTHDYDSIRGPFSYEAWAPKDILFKPLNQSREVNGEEFLDFYESDQKIKKYTPLLRDSPRYPLILDAKKTICSLPPLINSDLTKISLNTKNIFIEVTSTDATKGEIALKTLVTAFSFHSQKRFEVEAVKVIYETGEGPFQSNEYMLTLDDICYTLNTEYFNRTIGVSLSPSQIVGTLQRMMYKTEVIQVSASEKKQDIGGSTIRIYVPPNRSDVLHHCDIMEDVAIGYGYDNIPKTIPKTSTIAAAFPLNQLSDALRRECAFAGFTEALTLTLCSLKENGPALRLPEENDKAVRLSNPQTAEYQVVRTSLLPGLLKSLASNKGLSLPIQLFEVSDCVLLSDEARHETGARNERRLCAVYCGMTSGFEVIHGLLDLLMTMLDIRHISVKGLDQNLLASSYYIKESNCDAYFAGRRADVFIRSSTQTGAENEDKCIGTFGILHPDVLRAFEVSHAVSALEISIEPFL